MSPGEIDPQVIRRHLLALDEVLRPGFGARFRALAGFRNVLVHGYLDVDMAI